MFGGRQKKVELSRMISIQYASLVMVRSRRRHGKKVLTTLLRTLFFFFFFFFDIRIYIPRFCVQCIQVMYSQFDSCSWYMSSPELSSVLYIVHRFSVDEVFLKFPISVNSHGITVHAYAPGLTNARLSPRVCPRKANVYVHFPLPCSEVYLT